MPERRGTRGQVLYKYRSFENWRFIVDIIVNRRLYAAPFEALNDPMEGRYYSFDGVVKEGFKTAIYKSKLRRNICSLSTERANTLLWSYYAAGHTGVAFGVHVRRSRTGVPLVVRSVSYDSGVHLDQAALRRSADALALDILTQKQLPWQHEKEVRIFTRPHFVPIALTEIVLGCNATEDDAALITTLARRWYPKLKISKISRNSLDHPEAVKPILPLKIGTRAGMVSRPTAKY